MVATSTSSLGYGSMRKIVSPYLEYHWALCHISEVFADNVEHEAYFLSLINLKCFKIFAGGAIEQMTTGIPTSFCGWSTYSSFTCRSKKTNSS